MKEITRRLYTKPVILGMAFLMGIALVVGLFVTTKSTAAPNQFPVLKGYDEFETLADGETFHDFESKNIPAGLLGTGSLAYGELVAVEGVPLSSGSNVDTVIQRHQDVIQAGGTTSLTMTGLSLKSINPLKINYSGGGFVYWNMHVGLSAYKTSTGSMKINSSTFDSTLKVWPKFTFTRADGTGSPVVWDTGDPNGPGLNAADATVAGDGVVFEPAPAPTVAPAPCAAIDVFEGSTRLGGDSQFSAAAASSCPPVTLTSVNSPWSNCPGFCIPVPITEEERWARHRPHPKGTKKGGVVIGIGE